MIESGLFMFVIVPGVMYVCNNTGCDVCLQKNMDNNKFFLFVGFTNLLINQKKLRRKFTNLNV